MSKIYHVIIKNAFTSRQKCKFSTVKTSPNLDFDYLTNPDNYEEIKSRIKRRKSDGNLDSVLKLYKELQNSNDKECTKSKLLREAIKIPNKSHPRLLSLNEDPEVLRLRGNKPVFQFKPLAFEEIANRLGLIKTENISNLTGQRSYYLIDQLANLEQALIQYSVERLIENDFKLISVPDVLPRYVIDHCGMNTEGERTMVYQLENESLGKDLCLSGTAEMGIAAYLQKKTFKTEELPLKLAAVSRCYRAETSKIAEEKGLYRVHQFTKVEMFGVSTHETSEELLGEFTSFQENLFQELGLHLRVLEMPECELGSQAYRKFDIEAYMPGKKRWGEISSTSNCTDYQSCRLNIKYGDKFAHTINGTACAVPRMIIALMETHQKKDGSVSMPDGLIPFLGFKTIEKSKIPKIKVYKNR